jgi:ferredoxin-NADP reductase/MOSC domain-containing protein YiiM
MKLVSINVGKPKEVPWNGRIVRTAIWKSPVAGRVKVAKLGVDGDGQADLVGHGGEQRAVLVYQLSSYRYWQGHLTHAPFAIGEFGENLTVDGLDDHLVCIGDRYRIGSALFEVTQPRVTCFKVGIRVSEPRMPGLMVAHGRPGFYMRVIEEGEIGSGDDIVKVSSGTEQMTVAAVNDLLYGADHPKAELERALRIQALSPGWKGSFRVLLEAAGNESVGNVGLAPMTEEETAWTGFRPLRVVATHQESEDVRSYLLASRDGAELPAWQPGQHIAVKVPLPSGAPAIRTYSLSGSPESGTYRISVKEGGPGTVSTALHEGIGAGDALEVSAPRGVFTLREGATSVVLISAGVGVTPLLAMLYAIAASDEGATRPVWWIHGARDSSHHTFCLEARQALAQCSAGRRQIYYSRPAPSDLMGEDYDAAGHIDVAALHAHGLPLEADYYLCGPSSLLRSLTQDLAELGVESSRIHVEYFGAEPKPQKAAMDPSLPQTPRVEETSGPRVTFVRSGVTVRWGTGASYQSLLELAEAFAVPAQWSCRTGVCHSCQTPVLEGHVSYDPSPLSAPAHGTALLCCAKPLGDIAIDL